MVRYTQQLKTGTVLVILREILLTVCFGPLNNDVNLYVCIGLYVRVSYTTYCRFHTDEIDTNIMMFMFLSVVIVLFVQERKVSSLQCQTWIQQ